MRLACTSLFSKPRRIILARSLQQAYLEIQKPRRDAPKPKAMLDIEAEAIRAYMSFGVSRAKVKL